MSTSNQDETESGWLEEAWVEGKEGVDTGQ